MINNLGANTSQDKGWCQWNWALLRESLLSEYIEMIYSGHSVFSSKTGLKSGVMDVGNWVIYGMNA